MEKFLEVSKILDGEKDGREFKIAHFKSVRMLENGKTVFSGQASGTRLFNLGKEPEVGDLFEGSIISYETTPYVLKVDGMERTVNKTTVVVFGDETPIEVANKSLERNNACVVINGQPTKVMATAPKEPVVTAKEETEAGK